MMDPAYQMLASANGVTTFGAQMGQGTEGLINAANFEEMLSAQKQAVAAVTRAMNASRIAERTGNLAVNIANRAVQSARAMATLEEQGVRSPYTANERPILEMGPSPFVKASCMPLAGLLLPPAAVAAFSSSFFGVSGCSGPGAGIGFGTADTNCSRAHQQPDEVADENRQERKRTARNDSRQWWLETERQDDDVLPFRRATQCRVGARTKNVEEETRVFRKGKRRAEDSCAKLSSTVTGRGSRSSSTTAICGGFI
ncbi:unnamed protein product [Amoebophrya sp. A120]|nr:unnamed protein product [Amoebophrya sp. A120]|eukprot:GSA120T00017448001.1